MTSSERDRPLGKLIVLQRVREQAEREALAQAASAEAQAADAEREAAEVHRQTAERLADAEREPVGEGPPAQVLQFQSRFIRSLRQMAIRTEQRRAAARGERITAEEAAERIRTAWERARRARERFEEKERFLRRERQRERERREEAARDDLPPRGEGEERR